jgi:hypothetical protein
MTDDEMDERLLQGVRDYNEPGGVPREEMWARITAARSAAGASTRQRQRVWVWPAAGVAAAVLLTVGVVIGRRMERSDLSRPPRSSVQRVAVQPANPPATIAAPVAPAPARDPVIGQMRRETRNTDRRIRTLASTEREDLPADHAIESNLAYRLVVLQHLAGTEAMIASFRTSAKRGAVDAQVASWSRELLSTTRMLEASPAARDPVMKRLFEDLDLVIVQIVQYSTRGTNNPEDLDLIERSISKRGVITKLRGTIPGRIVSAGT